MTTQIEKIATKARQDRKLVFTSLAHHVTRESLWENLNKITLKTSPGVDEQDVNQAKETFSNWADSMLQKMHDKGYKPPPTRRVYIPKPGKENTKRPIAIPTVQDRCLQKSVADVLNSIYEQDFLSCSYGGRPKRSAHQAIADLHTAIGTRKVSYVFEADLKDFFGSLNQGIVEQFLHHRVGDQRIIKLIRSWMRAGVMDDGLHQQTNTGTAQGGPISVLLSNIYLHYVLDLWVEKVVKPRLKGEVYYIRYLDDFVLCFQFKHDANRFREILPKRLEKFSLTLESTKTRMIEFGRFAIRDAKRRSEKAKTFSFLGFCFYNSTNRHGKYKVGMKTEKSRLRRSCAKMKSVLLRIRHHPVREQWKLLNLMLEGHYRYYGIGGNSVCIDHFYHFTLRYWRKALSSRSQNGKINWKKFNHLLTIFPLRQPRLSLPFKAIVRLATL